MKAIWILSTCVLMAISAFAFAQANHAIPRRTKTSHNVLPSSQPLFAPPTVYNTGGSGAYSVVVADANGDGKPDLFIVNHCVDSTCAAGGLGILLGNGDGTFQNRVTYPLGGSLPWQLAVADVNGDGKLDIVVAFECSSSCASGAIGVLLGNGDGTFQGGALYDSGGYGARGVATADVNGDGKQDILVTNLCAHNQCGTDTTIGVLFGNGDGTFQPAVIYDPGGAYGHTMSAADLNGDGKPDLVIGLQSFPGGYGSVAVLLNNGDGTFQNAILFPTNAVIASVADVNGDGKADVLVNTLNSVSVLLGNGDGSFQPVVDYVFSGPVETSGPPSAADVNGAGKPDLLVAVSCSAGGCFDGDGPSSAGIFLSNGDGTFQKGIFYDAGGFTGEALAAADLNGDGRIDLVITSLCPLSCTGSSESLVGVLLNTGLEYTSTSLVSSLNPSNAGQAVTFTATVTSHLSGTPTGTVSFFDGTTRLGNPVLLNGSNMAAMSTSSLPVGTRNITAVYGGDSTFAGSTSAVFLQIVQGAVTSFNPSTLSFATQIVGTVSDAQSIVLTNTGNLPLALSAITITGTDSTDFLQTNNCPTSLAPAASCTIMVTFDPAAGGSRSAALTVTDNASGGSQTVGLTGDGLARDFSLAASQSSQTVTPGQAANYSIVVAPANGFSQTISFSCSGVPSQATCSVTPSSLTLDGSNQATVDAAVVTTSSIVGLHQPLRGNYRGGIMAFAGLLGIVFLSSKKTSRPRNNTSFAYRLALGSLLVLILALPGCGGGSSGSSGQTYHFTVTGASGSGSAMLTHAVALSLVVK